MTEIEFLRCLSTLLLGVALFYLIFKICVEKEDKTDDFLYLHQDNRGEVDYIKFREKIYKPEGDDISWINSRKYLG